ncbi:M61 family metallopeptidase [Polymorphobacter fuscus]|uniref:Peptidase M61 n=1 Tax=Sandarakinorhabdus fusca TaxID=1439888 RepID=A0A7C9GNU2_9SPHN|nr:M61 family metallopeptidase [Polymorphobacter fuscus]KAB7648889.1 M61 family metallopeptidase [Polymorphobacter fuscus]MQT16476.1 peptidase M61 [Polymorphobacter fuscus]NJC07234.1 putative metalloprotease with PDZ domain [Polymorphobacter fuscus]
MHKSILLLGLLATTATAAPLSKPTPLPFVNTIPAARDMPFPGTLAVKVDATDTVRGIFHVVETIPVPDAGPMTLLFPKWLPGNHGPRGEISKLAGLVITANGKTLVWKRDEIDVYAFHVDVPAGVRALDVRFDFLTPTAGNQGRTTVTADMISLQPNQVSLYPAGWFTRQIPASISVTWPKGWTAAGALRATATRGDTITYETVDYETLVDSPFIAGRYFRKWDLGHNVTLDAIADSERLLAATPAQIDAHKRLVDQAIKLFGTRQFDHYDLLVSLSENLGGIGLEHHRSSENGVNPGYFTEWDKGPGRRNLLPHEFTHSWNGKHRRGADSIVPDFSTPLRNSALWVYEGQTQFWGYVLGARSGLFTKQETLDSYAAIAASLDNRPARRWRSLDDTTNDPVISARQPKAWLSWQRSEDYYNEGLLIWMEVDSILRRETRGARGLDDFARTFFGTGEGDWGVVPYNFDDIVKTLNTVAPYDWSGLLTRRLTEKAEGAPLAGFTASGYKLVYTDTPTPAFADQMRTGKVNNLSYSGGLVIGKDGAVEQVIWDSAAFTAGLTVGDTLVAVNDRPYSDDLFKAEITAAKGSRDPIRLLVKTGDRLRSVDLAWAGGLRYPRFEKTGGSDTPLDRLLEPR